MFLHRDQTSRSRNLIVSCAGREYHSDRMIEALSLIFTPMEAWDRIIRAQRGTVFILTIFLLPLLALTSLVEGYGLVHWGERQKDMNYVRQFSVIEALTYETAQLVLSVGIVFVGAKIIKTLSETFHGRHTFRQAFTVVVYGLSPLFTLRLLDVFVISPWVAWAAGMLLSTVVLYHGVPRAMQPDPAHAFGLYLMSTLLLAIASGLVRFVTAWYLQGKFKTLESVFSDPVCRISFS